MSLLIKSKILTRNIGRHRAFLTSLHSSNLFQVPSEHKAIAGHHAPVCGVPFFRNYSDISKKQLPTLMDFNEIVWPRVLLSIKNWIMVHFIIRPYFDKEFTLQDFVLGAKQALEVVASSLSNGDTASLSEILDNDAIAEIKKSIAHFSVKQRQNLHVRQEDIYFSFPYQVGIMFDESNNAVQKRFVEITMVFHVLRGLKEIQERGEPIPLNIGTMPEYRDRISICNYRFIKEFTQGHESAWIVNIVNHFKPSDYIDEGR